MNYSFSDKLTIVIPTYNRHKFLKRTVKYWSSYDVKVLILDGSSIKFADSCLKAKNIRYVYDPRGLYERFLSSVDYIDTEFTILACDDEFYLPSALSTCVNFLLTEPSFSSCGGRAVGFRTKEKKILGINQYQKLKDLCLDYDRATDRISKHFSSYVPAHFYSVMRSAKWDIICCNIFKKKYSFFASFEMQMEFLTMISGKSKIISELMWMRNNEISRVDNRPDVSIEKWWYDKKNENEKISFLQNMKKACNDLSPNQNFILNEETISNLFEVYIKKILQYNNKNLFRKILNLLPNKIEIKLLKFVKKCFSIAVREKSLTEEINILEAEGVSVNSEELKKIISILQSPKNDIS